LSAIFLILFIVFKSCCFFFSSLVFFGFFFFLSSLFEDESVLLSASLSFESSFSFFSDDLDVEECLLSVLSFFCLGFCFLTSFGSFKLSSFSSTISSLFERASLVFVRPVLSTLSFLTSISRQSSLFKIFLLEYFSSNWLILVPIKLSKGPSFTFPKFLGRPRLVFSFVLIYCISLSGHIE